MEKGDAKAKNKYDEYYQKPSKHRQWNEHATAPIFKRVMSLDEVEYYRGILAKSYKCPIEDIIYRFMGIKDEFDDESDEFVYLIYTMKMTDGQQRTIYQIKIYVPDAVKKSQDARREFRRTNIDVEAKAICDGTTQGSNNQLVRNQPAARVHHRETNDVLSAGIAPHINTLINFPVGSLRQRELKKPRVNL